MSQSLNIIIVEKTGLLKQMSVKSFKEEELYKKCGFKKPNDFIKQTYWNVKYDKNKYSIQVFAKKEGRANSENKYDFPPPIDNVLFYGNCAIVAMIYTDKNTKTYVNLSIQLWEKLYEKLFGGFEDLSKTAIEDELEEDELKYIPKNQKTKEGYLKDGFVVDDNENDNNSINNVEEDMSELSEEEYNYNSS